jgi:hypothetical protein
MSFQYVPSQFRVPQIPNWNPPAGFWCGLGVDAGFYGFEMYNWGRFLITRNLVSYSLEVDGTRFTPVYSSINGYIFWQGNGYIYYTQTYGWVLSDRFPGYEPIEEYVWDENKQKNVYQGDSFWQISQFPSKEDTEVKIRGRGAAYEEKEKTLKAVWERWVSDNEFGEYEGKGGASGKKYLGLPRFRGNGTDYIRSFQRENGYYKYGAIHYAGGKWVIGEVGSDAGWHEGSEPSKSGSVTFKFCVNKGSDAQGQNISVSLVDYVKGDESQPVFLGEVAIWR